MTVPDSTLLTAAILIVDDQMAHGHLLARLLHETGYRNISSTCDPHQVCTLHRANRYDLILLDLQMPGLDGFGVMEGLRADSGDAYLPVIALTAQPGHKLRALKAGVRDFISKPFDLVEVRIRIHHMLEVRLLYKELAAHSNNLERIVAERTAEFEISEARCRSLVDRAVDWCREQNDAGEFIKASGPVMELLGQRELAAANPGATDTGDRWDATERQTLRDHIAARRPFLDFILHRVRADGSRRLFRVSGEPTFDVHRAFTGYRGVGVEVLARG